MSKRKVEHSSTRTKKIRVGLSYGRVSNFDQAFHQDGSRKDDASPEAQHNRCKDHILHLERSSGVKHHLIEHISDEGFSGKNTRRPGYQRMWDLIESGSIDFIVTTELSRLSRSVIDFLELVAHCEKHKVDICIIGLKLDTSEPYGRVVVIILVALAQFEREMTSMRVKENVLSRLVTDGKINGAAEILGLDRDPDRAGHFLKNEEELLKAEKILRLFLKFSSKRKLLDAAKEMGLTGKRGRELTAHMLDTMLENIRWRYKGLWFANKDNIDVDPSSLPASKQYQIIPLPHGPLLDRKLLEDVELKLADTYDKKKRSGKDNYIYLLSHVLTFEDGSSFSGQPAKNRQYRYYYNKTHDIRIRCDELDSVIISRIKQYFYDRSFFASLVESAIRRRRTELPFLEAQIRGCTKSLRELDLSEEELQQTLLDKDRRSKPGFMEWLEGQVLAVSDKKQRLQIELSELQRQQADIHSRSGLESLDKTLKECVKGFDKLSRVEQRDIIERIMRRIVVRGGNRIEFQINEEPSVIRRKKSTDSEENGVAHRPLNR